MLWSNDRSESRKLESTDSDTLRDSLLIEQESLVLLKVADLALVKEFEPEAVLLPFSSSDDSDLKESELWLDEECSSSSLITSSVYILLKGVG